jgi:hypothetical protein
MAASLVDFGLQKITNLVSRRLKVDPVRLSNGQQNMPFRLEKP